MYIDTRENVIAERQAPKARKEKYKSMESSSLDEMDICAMKVRFAPCFYCIHHKECLANDYKPVSHLGAYLAWLDLHALPLIEGRLSPICGKGIILEAFAPFDDEDTFATIRAYDRKNPNKRICRVLLDYAVKDIDQLTEMILQAYVLKKGKSRK